MVKQPQKISKIGLAGAACQILGTILYSGSLAFLPPFNFFPDLMASLFFMLSGILWTIEILSEDLPETATSRSQHIQKRFRDAFKEYNTHTLNTFAGVIAMLASTLALIGLYVLPAMAPLFWISNILIVVSCVGWYLGSTPPPGKPMTASDRLNQVAAVFQVLAIAFMFTATYSAAPYMAYGDLTCALISGITWLVSYCTPTNHYTKMALAIESLHGIVSPPAKDQEAFRLDTVDTPKPHYTHNPYLPFGYKERNSTVEVASPTAKPIIQRKLAGAIEMTSI